MGTSRDNVRKLIQQPMNEYIHWSSFDVDFDLDNTGEIFKGKVLLSSENIPYIKINDALLSSGYAQGNIKVKRILNSGVKYPELVLARHNEDARENMYINIYSLNVLKKSYPLLKSEDIASGINSSIFINSNTNNATEEANTNFLLEEIIKQLNSNSQSISDLVKERDELLEENKRLRNIICNINDVTSKFC